MSNRPPSDTFTRFTSNTPHASKTSFTSSQQRSQQSQPSSKPSQYPTGPSGETPAEKVARLRAASRLAKTQGSLTFTDRLISRGRTYADFAHRFTTYGLLAFTGISSVVAAYSLVSLVSHNRRQKRAWIEREMDRLQAAQQAFLKGEADAEQLHLLEQERAGEELARKFQDDKKRRKEEGVWHRIKGTFGSFVGGGDMGVETEADVNRRRNMVDFSDGVKVGDAGGRDRLLSEGWVDGEVGLERVAVQDSNIKGVGLDEKGRPVPINKVQKVTRSIENERRKGETVVTQLTGITGGPLDVLAGNVVDAVKPQSSQGWFSWISGGSKSS